MRNRTAKAVLFRIGAVLLGLAAFILLEVTLRLFDIGQPDNTSGFDPAAPLFERQGAVYRTARAREPFFCPQEFPAQKSSRAFRIFCLGGSTVYGHPYLSDTAFPRWLEMELAGADPTRTYQAVNCGGVSYASYRLLPILKEILRYQPDLVIITTGENEFLEDRTYQSLKSRSPFRAWFDHVAHSLRTLNLIRTWMRPTQPQLTKTSVEVPFSAEVKPRLDERSGYASYHRDDAWHQRVAEQFEQSINAMLSAARAAGVPVVLIKLGSNLRDCPPFKSEHRADLTPEHERAWQAAFDAATAAEAVEHPDLERALTLYRKAEAIVARGERTDAGISAALGRKAAGLANAWDAILFNSFHDILPGSSIGLVYDDARRDFAELEHELHALIGEGSRPVNTIGVPRREVVRTPTGEVVVVEAAPYASGRVVDAGDEVRADGLVLENAQLRVQLGEDGSVVSVVDRATGREALAAPGNRLELYEDLPVNFDAWDIDPFHFETRRDCPPAESWTVTAANPLRAEITFERRVGEGSTLRQAVRLDAGSRRVEFHTTVEWHEEHKLLKVCFPLDVRAANATYEMPFAYAERPTHRSTSFDRARYEVPGHRWADLSEHGFGAALLTDSKYGYSCYGNELRISLLRAPKSPDPEADMGRHEFAYALFPHAGGWREAGVVAEGKRFNAPLRWADGVPETSFASVDDPNVVLDTIKCGERSDALVLRLYEAHGGRGVARIRLAAPAQRARLANALEEETGQVEIDDGALVLPYRPHEVLTVLVD